MANNHAAPPSGGASTQGVRGTTTMQTALDDVRAIMRPLTDGKLWMKLLAVMMIITGALQVLTIIGILWAWLPIWLGVLLFQSASAAEQASASGDVALATRATDRPRRSEE